MEILDDLPRILFLLSFVVIGLLRWIANTIAERRGENQDEEQERWEEPSQPWKPPGSTTESSSPASTGSPPPLPDTLRDILESVTGVETTRPPAVPVRTLPAAPSPPAPTLSKAEEAALRAIRDSNALSSTTRRRARGGSAFSGLFGDQMSLKKAFVLKEILDEPKALKSPGTLGSF